MQHYQRKKTRFTLILIVINSSFILFPAAEKVGKKAAARLELLKYNSRFDILQEIESTKTLIELKGIKLSPFL